MTNEAKQINENLQELGLRYIENIEKRRQGTKKYYASLTPEEKTARAKKAVQARIRKGKK